MSDYEKKVQAAISGIASALRDLKEKKTTDENALDDLLRDVRGIYASPGPRFAIVSPMLRTQQTYAAITGASLFRACSEETCKHVSELRLSRDMTPEEITKVSGRAAEGQQDLDGIVPGVKMYKDNTENRRMLNDLNVSFENQGGDSVLSDLRRTLVGQVAFLIKSTNPADNRRIDEIAQSIEPPTYEQAKHIKWVQDQLLATGKLPAGSYNPDLVYQPLAAALKNVKDDTRLVVTRHAETDWVDLGLLTGGGADLPLNKRGWMSAKCVGALVQMLRIVDPGKDEVLLVSHSAGNALRQAAICASLPHVEETTNGAYSTTAPHIIDFNEGKVVIRRLTPDLLKDLSVRKVFETKVKLGPIRRDVPTASAPGITLHA